MYSIICLFPWLPRRYDFRAAVMKVFDITADQLVSLRKVRRNNIIIFTVASQEILISLSEFYFRILFFPILGHNILECFAFPKGPQCQFLKLSANPDDGDEADTGFLFGLGTVLYWRYLSNKPPSESSFRTNSIGVVLFMENETNDSAEPAAAPDCGERSPGNGQEDQIAMTDVLRGGPVSGGPTYIMMEERSAVGWQQPFYMPGCLHYCETASLQSVLPNQHEGSPVRTFEAHEEHLLSCLLRQHWGRSGHGNQSSLMGLSSSAQAPVRQKRAFKKRSAKDERLSENPKEEDQNAKSSSGHGKHSSSMGLSSPAQAPVKQKRASKKRSPKDERLSENPKEKGQNAKSSSGHGNESSSMGLSSAAQAPVKEKRASKKKSPKDERPSENPKAED